LGKEPRETFMGELGDIVKLQSLKKGCCIAPFRVMRFDGSRHIIYVMRSMASGEPLKLVHYSINFSLPSTLNLGKVAFISGRLTEFYQRLSFGVPKTLKILNN
jgi:hypothetical protein